MAGLSVACMEIPQGMSYASLAGLPNVFGLYGATIPCIIYCFFGSSRQLVSLAGGGGGSAAGRLLALLRRLRVIPGLTMTAGGMLRRRLAVRATMDQVPWLAGPLSAAKE